MRVAIAGIHLESATFSPVTTAAGDFRVTRGAELLSRYAWRDEPWAADAEWVPLVHARALPGGPADPDAYAAWRAEIVAGLPGCDGLLLDIHGALSVHGLDDAEGDLAAACRAALGPDALISAAMDLHGNVSAELFAACDLLTCYRTAPHLDAPQTRERAARHLLGCLRAGTRPWRAWVSVPVLLPGEQTATEVSPGRELYAQVPRVEAREGVLDAAIWMGFPWADEPRNRGAVVVTGTDAGAVRSGAVELATAFWTARSRFAFVGPVATLDGALAAALAPGAPRPYLVSDTGDNPGAGGADDVTVVLARLLRPDVVASGARIVHASITDPAAVAACDAAGVGARITVEVGGHLDRRAPSVPVTGTVTALADDPEGGRVAALTCQNVTVIVTSRRMQYRLAADYARLGLPLGEQDVVVVKIGYLEPDLAAAARGWTMALTPGAVDQDLSRLGHRRLARPLVPFDATVSFDPADAVVLRH